MNNRGMPIIGLGARSTEYAELPLQWMPHIQVADVAASVERALDLSGSELIHAKDDGGQSQWAVLLDPPGAAFGIIPVGSEEAFPSTEGVASRNAWYQDGYASARQIVRADIAKHAIVVGPLCRPEYVGKVLSDAGDPRFLGLGNIGFFWI